MYGPTDFGVFCIPEADSAPPSWLRNMTIADRASLVIDTGTHHIAGSDVGGGPDHTFDTGRFLGRLAAFARRASWLRPLGSNSYTDQINNMIAHFDRMGVVESRRGPTSGPFPPVFEVEDLHPQVRALAATLDPRAAEELDLSGIDKVRRFPHGLRRRRDPRCAHRAWCWPATTRPPLPDLRGALEAASELRIHRGLENQRALTSAKVRVKVKEAPVEAHARAGVTHGRVRSSALVRSPRGGPPLVATAALRRARPGSIGRAKRLVISERIEVVS